MSNLKDFNWTGFWNDVDYAFESYIGKPVTDDDIKAAEANLGYTLPVAYIELLKNHNGGVVKKNCFIEDFIKEYGFSVVEWNCASIYAGKVPDILS